jgi:hypothetical protein
VGKEPCQWSNDTKITLINTGVQPLAWKIDELQSWVMLSEDHSKEGTVAPGGKAVFQLHVYFDESIVSNSATQVRVANITAADHGSKPFFINAFLDLQPGRFSAEESTITMKATQRAQVNSAQIWTLQTKDRYGQPRGKSARTGASPDPIEMRAISHKGVHKCVHRCGTACTETSSASGATCCCKDNRNGLYSLSFTASRPGLWQIEAVANDTVANDKKTEMGGR